MDAYLQRKDLPSFLKPAGSAIIYSNVDLSNRQTYKKENYKYHQYYENLSNNINSTGAKSTFFPDDSFSYYKTHKVYRPVGQSTNTQASEETRKAFQEFDSFVDFPTLFSDYPLRGLSYHTAVDMPDGIYVFNGLEALHSEEYKDLLMKITNNFTIPPTNITIDCDYDIPSPIDKEKILSMGLRPCRTVKRYLPDSKSFRFVAEMAESLFEDDLEDKHEVDRDDDVIKKTSKFRRFTGVEESDNLFADKGSKINTDALKATLNRKAKSESNSSNILHSLPKPLISSAAAKVSERYFLMYGGLEIQTRIKHPDPMHCVITKKLVPNNEFWIFDTFTCKFRELKLSIHPTYSSVFPNSVPRFGHSLTYSLEESTKQSSETVLQSDKSLGKKKTFSKLVVIYVMGGYKSSACYNSFVAMNDLWKCDLFLDSQETSEEAVASPIGNFTMVNEIYSYIINKNVEMLPNIANNLEFKGVMNHTKASSPWPRPRGFFSMELIDEDFLSEYVQWRKNDSMIFEESEEDTTKIHSPVPTVKTKLNFSFLQTSVTTKTLLDKEVMNKTISRSSDYTQSSSSSTDQNTSFSPTSESTTNTSNTSMNKRKLLLILGGSTTLYTKYSDDENNEEHVFYTRDILNDIWIFDFRTENWYELSELVEIRPKLAICGHSILVKNKAIKLLGGIEKSHYPYEYFEPLHADLHVNCLDFKVAQKCVSRFFDKIQSKFDNSSDIVGRGFNLMDKYSSCYCSYCLYDLDFSTFKWKVVRLAFVRSLEYFGPWNYYPGCKILTGTVITKSVALQDADNSNSEFDEEFEISSKARLKDHHI
ncbi:hypothetical protein CANINC_002303 [Pichia inconspicua]|uniref:Uncharacterized protein n=1 Tax=Pichia inconspicua TaxID=52247 RepID=A0A4T0X1W9_9ASCO|nr:hypothetical protein CANINC_002303 [[Candida] inconspicua]